MLIAKKEDLWNGIHESFPKNRSQDLWRNHSDAVNKALLLRWWPIGGVEYLPKTDLFDEAVNDGLSTLLTSLAKRAFYIDQSKIALL
jgi:hypothetical protein